MYSHKNPCYDKETKTDCPDRKPGCQIDCKKWKEYSVDREKRYEKRIVQARSNALDDYEFSKRWWGAEKRRRGRKS